MIDLKEIKRFYPNELHQYERFILKEYLQYKIWKSFFQVVMQLNWSLLAEHACGLFIKISDFRKI